MPSCTRPGHPATISRAFGDYLQSIRQLSPDYSATISRPFGNYLQSIQQLFAMSENAVRETLEAVKRVVAERDMLRAKLNVASTVIEEEQRIINHQYSLLSEAHSRLSQLLFHSNPEAATPQASNHKVSSSKSDWINVTWLSVPANKALLGPTEEAFRRGARQEALNAISAILAREDLRRAERVYAKLLLSEILRSAGNLTVSLYHTDQALEIARGLDDYRLCSIVQFYRGLCFLHLNRYTDASWSFIQASHTEDYQEQVDLYRNIAEKERQAMHPTDPRRELSDIFE
ncbi:hypothetical protein MMC11_004971 [Xylographa trunciseda]|nr:hypothetical protein [Xylographa trunciseda]